MRNHGGDAGLETNHALGTDDLHAKGAGGFLQSASTAEGCVDAAVHRELRVDVVANHGTHPVTRRFLGINEFGRSATLPDAGMAPCHLAAKEAHEIEDVQTEDNHVLSTGARSHLANRMDFEHVADESLLQCLLQTDHNRRKPGDMGDGDLPLLLRGELEDLVGLGERHGEGFFEVDVRADFQGRHRHRVMFSGPTRRHGNEIRFFLRKHFMIVGVPAGRFAVRLGLGAARVTRIGNRNDFDVRQAVEDKVHTVTKIPRPRMADDGGLAGGFGGCREVERERRRCRDPAGKEFSPIPVFHHGCKSIRRGPRLAIVAGRTKPAGSDGIECDGPVPPSFRLAHLSKMRFVSLSMTCHSPKPFAALAAGLTLAFVDAAPAQSPHLPKVEVENVRRVFHNGEHNAFTDLIRWKGKFWLTFRSCPDGHMVFSTSRIIVLTTEDTESWEKVYEFSVPRRDTRDPHFLVFRDQLFVYTGTWWSGDGELPRKQYDINKHLGYGVKTADGKQWSQPFQLEGTYGHYIWRAATHDGKAYLCARRKRGHSEAESGAGATPIMESAMLESEDGINWRFRTLFQTTKGNETAFQFSPNGDLLAISRNHGREGALLVQASPPYQHVTRKPLAEYIGGPLLARWGNEWMVGGRRFTKAGPRTILYWLHNDAIHEFADLPSGGDTSYPGFVELDDGTGLVSWYSSHEKDATGKKITAIYLADLKRKR